MKLKSLLTFGLAMFAMGITACDDDDYTSVVNLNVDGPEAYELPLSGASAPMTIAITASSHPEANSEQEWIHVGDVLTKDVNAGKYEVYFTVDANDGEDREGAVNIFALDKVLNVKIVQTGSAVAPTPDEPTGNVNHGTLGMTSNAKQLAAKIFAGVNIGNTMEACDGKNRTGSETAWGQPTINNAYLAGLKAAGFNAVRIPCSWYCHSDAKDNIDAAWLARVEEVISMCVDNDLYVVLNAHWDGGWLEDHINEGYKESIDKRMEAYWDQIASKLKDFDEHLMFAGMNEPGMNGGMNDNFDALQRYQQTFINTVRATGGNNATRVLIVQGPSTDIDMTEKSYKMPTDEVADRLMVEVHFYDPSDFTIMSKDGDWSDFVKLYWGANNHVEGSKRNCTWGEEAHVDSQFAKMKNKFVNAGIPVIIGEYSSASDRSAFSSDLDMDKWKASRADWNEYITRSAKNNGCVPFYWETGGDINRNDGSVKNAYAIDALMKGAKEGTYPY